MSVGGRQLGSTRAAGPTRDLPVAAYGAVVTDLTGRPAAEPLRTERLDLEPLTVEHAAEMAPALNDAALHTYIGGAPATLGELTARYGRQVVGGSSDGTQRWCNWVLRQRSTGRVAGYVQATIEVVPDTVGPAAEHRGRLLAELAWVVAVPAQGQGLAREATDAVVSWLHRRGIKDLVAHVNPQHAASVAVARSIGLSSTDVTVDGEVRYQS